MCFTSSVVRLSLKQPQPNFPGRSWGPPGPVIELYNEPILMSSDADVVVPLRQNDRLQFHVVSRQSSVESTKVRKKEHRRAVCVSGVIDVFS